MKEQGEWIGFYFWILSLLIAGLAYVVLVKFRDVSLVRVSAVTVIYAVGLLRGKHLGS